ncbi:MAG TPA: allantoate amidohydrolase [Candidatus Dormibacteraeota bacterium]|nr:allantoate amidohydrolase [Candidatus Dormibacteraeota bacterium]
MSRDAATVMQRCEVLSECSEEQERLTRPFASIAMHQAHEHVTAWMQDAGMAVRRDNVGNLRGRYEGTVRGSATLLLGSHLDSVRDAGKYDGPLGVMVAIAAVHRLHSRGAGLPFAIEVLAFADEEGLRYGASYLGSRALAGTFNPADLARADAKGVTMAEAIRAFGGDPDRLAEDRWNGGRLRGYCEVHIEQGRLLEARDLPVGVVSAIAGFSRWGLTFTGKAAHAGTTPMDRRQDALAAAAEFVLGVEAEARATDGLVATVGQLAVSPGAVNVVPGEVVLSLDVRHANNAIHGEHLRRLLQGSEDIAKRRGLSVESQPIDNEDSVACSPQLTSVLARAVQELGHPAIQLASGAGHDAVVMSGLTDVAMLFVRCKGGISHNPAESVTVDDVAVAIDVLGKFLELLATDGE